MVALGVLFGRRSHSLERSNNYSGLIKTGTNQAVIRVIINNYNQFKKDKYGEHITIEKIIRIRTTRTLISHKINENIKMQAAKSSEIKQIVDEYQLSFDNPLNFMTQEMSKRFLSSVTPTQLYDLYYRGTEFKTIYEEMNEGITRLNEMKNKLTVISDQQTRLTNTIDLEEQNLEILSTDFESELGRLEMEEEMCKIAKEIKASEKIRDEIERLEKMIEIIKEEQREEINKIEQTDQQIRDMEIKRKIKQEIKTEIKTDLEEYKEEYKRKRTVLEKANKPKNKEILKEKIETKNEEIKENEKDEENMTKRISELKKKRDEYIDRAYILKKQAEYIRTHANDQHVDGLTRTFKQVEMEMAKTKFKNQVIGPLCKYIKLKNQKWYKPASIILKKSLTSYIVLNKSDKLELLEIFKRLHVNFTVTELSSSQPITKINKPDCGPNTPPTLLDVLEILPSQRLASQVGNTPTNQVGNTPTSQVGNINSIPDLITKHIIMLHSAEQILMIGDRDDAYRIVRAAYQYVESAYLPNGNRIKLISGSLSDFKARDDGKYWFEDKTSRLHKIEEMIANLDSSSEQEYKLMNERLKRIQEIIKEGRAELARYCNELEEERLRDEQGIGNIKEDERRCEKLKESIEILERKEANITEELNEVEKEIKKLNKEREQEESRKRKEKIEEMKRRCEIEGRREATKRRINEKRKELEEIEERIAKQMDKRDEQSVNENNAENYLNISAKNCTNSAKHDTNNSTNCTSAKSTKHRNDLMAQLCLLADIDEYLYKINNKKIEIKQQIKKIKEMNTKEETKGIIEELKRREGHYKMIYEKYEGRVAKLIEASKARLKKIEEIKERKTEESKKLFREYVRRRGYDGELIFDHEGQRLDMEVAVHGNRMRGTRATLSGGERSYVAVCLLMSLWMSFSCPVKALDEFDVFMDPVNRNSAIKMMFEVLRYCGTQAILITPLNMDDFAAEECDIKVVEKVTS